MPLFKQIEMTPTKDCKNSVRYGSTDPNAVVDNVYMSKDAAKDNGGTMPAKIFVTISEDPFAAPSTEQSATSGKKK